MDLYDKPNRVYSMFKEIVIFVACFIVIGVLCALPVLLLV